MFKYEIILYWSNEDEPEATRAPRSLSHLSVDEVS